MENVYSIMLLSQYISARIIRKEKVARLIKEVFPNWKNPYKLMNSPRYGPNIIAVKGKTPIGFLFPRKKNGNVHLHLLGVAPSMRMNGIGTNMVAYAIKVMSCDEECCLITAYCHVSSTVVLFYQKLGFKISDILLEYYKDGDSAYELELETACFQEKV